MIYIVTIGQLRAVIFVRYLKFEDITFYNLSVYHYHLHDKQNCIITSYAAGVCGTA
jgi:hypothetical protein